MKTVYVPILKSRQGEINALKLIQPATRTSIQPLIELVPSAGVTSGEDGDATAIARAVDQTIGKLMAACANQPIMVDAGFLDLFVSMPSGFSALGDAMRAARQAGLVAQPVVRLCDPKPAIVDAASAARADGYGVTVRLLAEDLDEDPEDVEEALAALLKELGVGRGSVDLLLDLASLDGDIAVRGGASLVRATLRGLEKADQWRSLIVAGGAFPVDLAQFNPWVLGERPRYDARLYDAVVSRRTPGPIRFGDYAVAHPALATGTAFSPPPQLRYTTAEHWLILKGKRNDPRGNEQFYEICERIAQHPEFVGTGLGQADARIALGSTQPGPGNGTTWRTLGTTHHLDFVVQRLTNLGEP
jgi:hypothetical protein